MQQNIESPGSIGWVTWSPVWCRYWNTTNQDLIQLPDGYEESCGQSIVEGWGDMTEAGALNAALSMMHLVLVLHMMHSNHTKSSGWILCDCLSVMCRTSAKRSTQELYLT